MRNLNMGERLRAFRRRRAIKQEAVAFDLGVSQATVSRLESGAMAPSEDVARRIEALLARPENLSPFDYWRSAVRNFGGYFALFRVDRPKPDLIDQSGALEDWQNLNPDARRSLRAAVEREVEAAASSLGLADQACIRRSLDFGGAPAKIELVPVVDDAGRRHVLIRILPED